MTDTELSAALDELVTLARETERRESEIGGARAAKELRDDMDDALAKIIAAFVESREASVPSDMIDGRKRSPCHETKHVFQGSMICNCGLTLDPFGKYPVALPHPEPAPDA